MTLQQNFVLMADYNQWMNQSLYSAAAKLDTDALHEERGAFFGSIFGTLSHIMVGDVLWIKRFADHPAQLASLEYVRGLDRPTSLDITLYSSFEELRAARVKLDEVFVHFTSELTDDILASSLSHKSAKGIPFSKNTGALIQHFFNHQTHHRGQVSTLFNQLGIDVGVTDLFAIIPYAK